MTPARWGCHVRLRRVLRCVPGVAPMTPARWGCHVTRIASRRTYDPGALGLSREIVRVHRPCFVVAPMTPARWGCHR